MSTFVRDEQKFASWELPHTKAMSGDVGFLSLRVCSMGSVPDTRRVILGVMWPLAASNSSKNSVTPSRSGFVPPYSAVPPGLFGTAVHVMLVAWVRVYSVGLNMHSIAFESFGLLSLTTSSRAFLGLMSPAASPTALAADPTASMTIVAPQRPIAADPVIAPARAPTSPPKPMISW